MKRIICWIVGHRWKRIGGNQSKMIGLVHLHSQAGCIDLCVRCGLVWDDFYYGFGVDREPEARAYHTKALATICTLAIEHGLKLRGDV